SAPLCDQLYPCLHTFAKMGSCCCCPESQDKQTKTKLKNKSIIGSKSPDASVTGGNRPSKLSGAKKMATKASGVASKQRAPSIGIARASVKKGSKTGKISSLKFKTRYSAQSKVAASSASGGASPVCISFQH